MNSWLRKNILYIAWTCALLATIGSLYFSEIQDFPPCVLCWYQRVAMFPLLIILTVGILIKDKRLHFYTLPVSIIGLIISVYHNLLYYKIIPESISPCVQGVSCMTKYIEWFGFITIPLLSLLSFAIITFCMIIFQRNNKK